MSEFCKISLHYVELMNVILQYREKLRKVRMEESTRQSKKEKEQIMMVKLWTI